MVQGSKEVSVRGFNQGVAVPKRNLSDVTPMRFNLIVRIIPEAEPSQTIAMPESYKRHKDSTRGWFGMIKAVGSAIPKMRKMVGLLKPGTLCLFDESVSIDDPNRCFDWEDERYVMFDVETVMGIRGYKAVKGGTKLAPPEDIHMLGDRLLVRRPKKDDFKITQSKLWIPAGQEKQEVGGVVVATGPGLYNPDRNRHLPMDFKPGDFVLFPKYGATDIKIDGVDFAVIRQDKVLAVVEGETERVKFN